MTTNLRFMPADFSTMLGETLLDVTVDRDDDVIAFTTATHRQFLMQHNQDCCESVVIEDIIGDVGRLIGLPLTMCELVTSNDTPDDYKPDEDSYTPESQTWSFYKMATISGYVTIRWWGQSNGYYSETVSFYELKEVPEGYDEYA